MFDWVVEQRKLNAEHRARVDIAIALFRGRPLAYMFDLGFLCRHGIQYAACSICTNATDAPGQVPCPWRYTDHTDKRECPACHNTGWVEALE